MNQNLYIGLILLLIGGLIIYFGFNHPTHSITFIFSGAIPAGIGYFLIKRRIFDPVEQEGISDKEWCQDLKKRGIAIVVPFEDCEFQNSQFQKETDQSTLQHYNGDQTAFIFKTEVNGTMATFHSPVIQKNSSSLAKLLASKKITTLYIDPSDIDIYYFDLEFIHNK
ncbi:MAG: hypothetical protein AAFO69_03555 [Bacteroidota bacterium]